MRTLKAVLAGFLFSSAMIIAGAWFYSLAIRPNSVPGHMSTAVLAAVGSLVFICAAVVIGARVATGLDDTSSTLAGYVVFELFFGIGLTGPFLNNGANWVTEAAILLVIPCTLLGRAIARRRNTGAHRLLTHPANR